MSGRIAVGAQLTSATAGAAARNADSSSRAAVLPEPAGGAGAANADGASTDGGPGGGGGSAPFATALADANAASGKGTRPSGPGAALTGQTTSTRGPATGTSQQQPPMPNQTQMQLPTPAQTIALAAAPTATGATSVAAGGAQGISDEADNQPDGSPQADSTPGVPAHGALHRGRTSGSVPNGGMDLLSALALLQGSVGSLAVQAQAQLQGPSGAAQDEDGQDDAEDAGSSGPAQIASAGATAATAATDDSQNSATTQALSWLTEAAVGAGSGSIDSAQTTGATPAGAKAARTTGTDVTSAASLLPQLLSSAAADVGTTGSSRSISTPLSDPSWPQALAAQVQWMAGSQVQSATLSLSPAHLGPIQVRIDLQQSQINVSFSAAHADTRSALADALPQLRQMLASGGLSLGQASVQQEAPGSGGAQPQAAFPRGAAAESETVQPVAVAGSRALGLVDEYA